VASPSPSARTGATHGAQFRPRKQSQTWFRGRNYDTGRLLETFFVCAATGVVANRVFLILTGYPQLGNQTLHISHAIWGALAMMVSLTFALTFLSPALRGFLAVFGGLGFGWFVDELGKFISRDTDYFFQPALALIYLVFLAMFFWFRHLASRRFTPDDAVVNALESLQAAHLGALTDERRAVAIARLTELGGHDPFVTRVRELLADTPASPPLPRNAVARWLRRGSSAYEAWTDRPTFVPVVTTVFVAIGLGLVVTGFVGHDLRHFSSRLATAAGGVAALAIVIGVVVLPRNRLAAFHWFDRAVLVWILVVQVYLFDRQQFAATGGLVVALAVWALVRSALAIEERRTSLRTGAPPRA